MGEIGCYRIGKDFEMRSIEDLATPDFAHEAIVELARRIEGRA